MPVLVEIGVEGLLLDTDSSYETNKVLGNICNHCNVQLQVWAIIYSNFQELIFLPLTLIHFSFQLKERVWLALLHMHACIVAEIIATVHDKSQKSFNTYLN